LNRQLVLVARLQPFQQVEPITLPEKGVRA